MELKWKKKNIFPPPPTPTTRLFYVSFNAVCVYLGSDVMVDIVLNLYSVSIRTC